MQSTHNLAVVQRVTPTKRIDDPKQAIAAIVAGLQASDPRADENALAFRLMENWRVTRSCCKRRRSFWFTRRWYCAEQSSRPIGTEHRQRERIGVRKWQRSW